MRGEPVRGSFPDPGFGSLPGLERVRAYARGLVPWPPLSHLIGLRTIQAGPGSATVTMPASPWLVDPGPGGAIQQIALLEASLHLAALTGAPPGADVATTTLSMNYLRVTNVESGMFVARARVVHSGRTFTLAEANVEDAGGRAVAQGSASLITRPIDPPPPAFTAPLVPVSQPAYPTPDPYLRPPPATHPIDHASDDQWFSILCGIASGEYTLPPAFELFGYRIIDITEGSIAAVTAATGWLCGAGPVVSPGVLGYMALVTMHGAACTVAGTPHVALLNGTFSFLRPVIPDGRDVITQGTVTHRSGDLFVARVEMIDADGNHVVVGQDTAVKRQLRAPGPADQPGRELLTVLFTDIVGSTERAEAVGDAAWRALLAEHDAVVRKQVELFKGTVVKSTGDGSLSTFDSPARAIQCARAVRSGLERLGLEMRAGLHTGECEIVAGDVAGIAVHVAARLVAVAAPGEVLVSSTVPELVAGSGIQFLDRGLHELKGIEGKRHVFAVAG